jgi:hypothetical protein
MKNIKLIILLIVAANFLGCSWFLKPAEQSLSSKGNSKHESSKIVDQARLQQGGKIVVTAFTAGANVEAGEKLDQISLSAVKGIADIIGQEGSKFQIVTSESVDEADFLLEGHITAVKQPSKMKRWLLRSKKITVSMEGKMRDLKTGEPVLMFNEKREMKNKELDHRALAVAIGQELGRKIVDGSH